MNMQAKSNNLFLVAPGPSDEEIRQSALKLSMQLVAREAQTNEDPEEARVLREAISDYLLILLAS